MRTVSSGRSIGRPSIFTGVSWPLSSTCGGRPGEKIRSLTDGDTRSIVARTPCVGGAGAAAGAAAGAGIAGVATGVLSSQEFFGGELWGNRQPPAKDGQFNSTCERCQDFKI